jgi:hypothetical protein
MKPVYYLFEPALTRLMPHENWSDNVLDMFLCTLFEDGFLNQISGRVNTNKRDWSWYGHYFTAEEIKFRREKLPRRKDAIALIADEKPLYVIKQPEAQRWMPKFMNIFPGCKFIHIIRNGLDVVRSMVSRGWYTDEHCNSEIIDWVGHEIQYVIKDEILNSVGIPWWIDEADHENWSDYNPETRAACAWRSLTDAGIQYCFDYYDDCIEIIYEDFCKDPIKYIDIIANKWNLRVTNITADHIERIEGYDGGNPNKFELNILEPERSKFYDTMNRLGYEI